MTRLTLAQAWTQQIAWCEQGGSPFTARVLEAAWADRERGGALAALLPDWPGDPVADAVALRVAGALRGLTLTDAHAALSALYPPQCASFDAQRAPPAIAAALDRHRDTIADYLALAPQTNEIGRSAVLLGGFAVIARETGRPLATLEIGASAGLNQLWHRYRYDLGQGLRWGDAASPVPIRSDWQGTPPALPERIEIASQAASDLAPIDLATPGAAMRLLSYVWADQRERVERLQAAIALASSLRLRVQASDALPWVREALATTRPGMTTVLYHLVMWQYMPQATRDALRREIEAAGTRATQEAPLAWLAFEPPKPDVHMELVLTLWPGGQQRVLADAHPHGRWVRWRG